MGVQAIEEINKKRDWAKDIPTLTSQDAGVQAQLEKQRDSDIEHFATILGQQRYQEMGLVTFLMAKYQRHHRRGDKPNFGPLIIVWVVSLICVCCSKRKGRKLRDRIENLLTLENRTIFRDMGFVWSINSDMTVLTLSKMGQAPVPHQIYPQSNPFVAAPAPAPQMQMVNVPRNHVRPQNYVTVPMDDSVMMTRGDEEYR